ncbi:Transposase [Rickettsiales bacterium Ac37b]|nr:Transposase [Rickettsiales bacterium Ac37b]
MRKEIFALYNKGVSRKDLAKLVGVSTSTIERCYHALYKSENKEFNSRLVPRVLGIDEHSFSKKQGFATTCCNLARDNIFDVVKGKSAKDLEDYLSKLEGREMVRVVCIDTRYRYHAIIRKWFPNAKIVADRFHVIRLVNYYFVKQAQMIDPETKHKRSYVKLLMMHKKNMTEEQSRRFKQYLEGHPAIRSIYEFKEKLINCLREKRKSKPSVKYDLIPVFLEAIKELKNSSFTLLQTLGKTLSEWKDERGRMWRFSRNNGITEGFHRKMKLIQRRTYGFKNFENYRLRVKVLCS